MYIFIHYLSSGDIYIYIEREREREREREIDLGGGAPTHHSPSHIPYDLQPARNIIIPGHHLRYVYIHSLFINKSDLLIEMSNQEYPSMSQGGPRNLGTTPSL